MGGYMMYHCLNSACLLGATKPYQKGLTLRQIDDWWNLEYSRRIHDEQTTSP